MVEMWEAWEAADLADPRVDILTLLETLDLTPGMAERWGRKAV